MKHSWKIALLLIGLLLVAVVFAPVPGGTVWSSKLHDSAHGPVFGCVAVLLLLALPRRQAFAALGRASQYAIALMGAAVLGLLTEVAQIPAGRDASWSDVRHDLIGAAAFLALFALIDPLARAHMRPLWRKSAALMAGVALLGYLAAPVVRAVIKYHERRSSFPLIADFSHSVDLYFIWRSRVIVEFAQLPAELSASIGESAARVRFLPRLYPGLNFHEPWPDWRDYSTLAIDLANPTDRALELVIRVHDAHHNNEFNDRYNKRLTLPANLRAVYRMPLDEIQRAPHGRAMDMQRIRSVVLFRADESSPDEMYVSRLWLE